MENENLIVEKKGSLGIKVALILIVVAIIGALTLFIYKYKFQNFAKNPKSIYIYAIDQLNANSKKMFKESENFTKSGIKTTYDVSFEMKSSKSDLKDLVKLINKTTLNGSTELDVKKKIMNTKFGLTYEGGSLIDMNTYLYDSNMYIEAKDLLDKIISMPFDDEISIWNMIDMNDYKTIVDSMTKIIKNNLKDEYFSTQEENITIMGSEIKSRKQTLSLDSKRFEEFRNNMIDSMLKDDKLLKALSSMSKLEIEEIKSNLLSEKSVKVLEENNFKIDIYLSGNNKIEKVVINNPDIEFIFERSGEKKYDILVHADDEKISLGNIDLKDDEIDLNIDFDGVKLNYVININNNKLSSFKGYLDMDNIIKLEFDFKEDNNKGNGYIKISVDGTELKINLNYGLEQNIKISKRDITNSVGYENLTQEDSQKLYENLMKNEKLITFVQDINSLFPVIE